jgi:RNA polymerase sigma factor (TIGR02999 family)
MRDERPDHTLQATAVVNEAYLRIAQAQAIRGLDRRQMVRLLARVMRRVLVDHAREHRAQKRQAGLRRVGLSQAEEMAAAPDLDLMVLDEALTALAAIDPQKAVIVELRFFGGLSVDEVARHLGVAPITVHREWRRARAWLCRALGGGQGDGS